MRAILSIIAISVGFLYVIIDFVNEVKGGIPFYLTIALGGIISIYLNFKGRFFASSVVLLSAINGVVFLFAEGDSQRVGTYMFFICTCITAFSLFGYENIAAALTFSMLSLTLYVLGYLFEFEFVSERILPEDKVMYYLSLNVVIALVTSVFIVFFLLQINHHAEQNLLNKAVELEKSQEEIVRKNTELLQTNQELDRFVYSVSHDLRAPLSSILGLVHVYDISNSLAEKDEAVKLVRSRVDKLDSFIKEILDFSRNARTDINKVPTDLNEIANEVIESVSYIPTFLSIQFRISLPKENVIVDRDRIRIVLNNLIVNAVKYADSSKQNCFVSLTGAVVNSTLVTTVSDNGLGIHAQHIPKIFDMFYRATNKSDGSGLGLYIVRETINKMGGQIEVKSEIDIGTTFKFSIPI